MRSANLDRGAFDAGVFCAVAAALLLGGGGRAPLPRCGARRGSALTRRVAIAAGPIMRLRMQTLCFKLRARSVEIQSHMLQKE